ncbi:MAG: citrate (Si)-synthase [Chlamydiota bacterium]
MAKVLFEITEDQLETGLRGYPCGYCVTSFVDPQKGLLYAGHPVSELIDQKPEDVIRLLYFGELSKEKSGFSEDLRKRSSLSPKTIAAIEALPREGHPMKFFSAALLILGMMEGVNDYREDCLNVIAKIPHLAAVVINTHAGWGKTPKLRPELGYMESFTELLQIPGKKKRELEQVFKLFNILHYDHGGGNLSAFVGKAVASGLEDMYGSLSACLCALAGPRHGKANQDSLNFVEEVLQHLGENATEKDVEAFLQKKVDEGELIFGFGHAVLKVEDPRATVLYDCAERNYKDHPLVKIAGLLRKVGPKVLAQNPKISCPYPNIDAISGTLLMAAGFSYPDYFTVLFGLSRCVGVGIQIVYERMEARGGKGTPIVRPKYIYKARE